jgi:hypothetical protein
MMPLLTLIINASGQQRTHLSCLDWVEIEFTFKEDDSQGAYNAQAMVMHLLCFQKS